MGREYVGIDFHRRRSVVVRIGPRGKRLSVVRIDNALAETTNGLYKTECVHGPDAPRHWDDVDELELATLSWVHWFNEHRLHGHRGDVPPVEYEAAFYAAQQVDPAGVGNQ
jgi:putative transposase